MTTRLHALREAGTAPWLDYIDRTMLANGELARRINDDALMGMTSNPTIFEKALSQGTAYDSELSSMSADLSDRECFEKLAVTDVQNACDAFAGVYASTAGVDGYVSLEVSPDLAHDANGTVVEARRLWLAVDRPNLMIKVPATDAGIDAVSMLLSEGINVNVTLLFSLSAYKRVMNAYLEGLESLVSSGGSPTNVASVASFFISRVDSAVDAELEKKIAVASNEAERDMLSALLGKAAIANAKLVYKAFWECFSSNRWLALEQKGAKVQRPLWASTGTKNPSYSDVLYVESLIGPNSVNTLPPATLDAFRDHGNAQRTIDRDMDQAEKDMAAIAEAGIDIDAITDKLLIDGLASFSASFVSLLSGLSEKRARIVEGGNNG